MNRRAHPTLGKGFGDGLAGRTAVHADAAYQQGWRIGQQQRRDLYAGLWTAGVPTGVEQRPPICLGADTLVRVGVAADL